MLDIYNSKTCAVWGTDGNSPGNGGDGGLSGIGGFGGKLELIGLSQDANISVYNGDGKNGPFGVGGKAGKVAHNGAGVTVDWERREVFFRVLVTFYTTKLVSTWPGDETPPGSAGKDNASTIAPEKAQKLNFDASPVIVKYKRFLIENMNGSGDKLNENVYAFLNGLNGNSRINSMYNLLDLIRDVQSLESEYFHLKNKDYFTQIHQHLYQSILNRTVEFANAENRTTEDRRALSYLYTAVLSKICAQNLNANRDVYVDLPRYLKVQSDEIAKMKSIDNQQTINKYRDEYKQVLDAKIAEANTAIDTEIIPDVNRIVDKLKDDVRSLINDTVNAEKELIKNEDKIREAQKNAEKKMRWHELMFITKIVGAGLSVFGPVASGIGLVAQSAASVADSLIAGDSAGDILKGVNALSDKFENAVKLVKEKYTKKADEVEKYLEKAKTDVADLKKDQPNDPDVKEIEQVVNESQTELSESIKSQDPLAPESKGKLDKLIDKLQTFYDGKFKTVVVPKVKQFVDTGRKISTFFENSINLYDDFKTKQDQVNELYARMANMTEQLKVMRAHEKQIYDILLPALFNIQNTIRTMKEQIKNKSHVQLDISRLKIKTSLQSLKTLFQDFTKNEDDETQSEFKDCIEKLSNGMSLMINIYDRIDSYKDNAQLAAYIANVGSKELHFDNADLNDAMTDLTQITQSNLVLEMYETAIQAFKQHYFPFAPQFLAPFNLPADLMMNDTKSLVDRASLVIGELKKQIELDSIKFGKYDKYLTKNSNYHLQGWNYETIGNETIAKLLQGQPTDFYFDITKGIKNNAVKFKTIGIKFQLRNASRQSAFDDALKSNFSISFKLAGNSYFRCDDRFYYVSMNDNIDIDYSFAQNADGQPQSFNFYYEKIYKNDFFISPYANWVVSIKNHVKDTDFARLSEFLKEPMDLEFTASTQYIDHETKMPEICDEQLDNYYRYDSTIKDTPDTNRNTKYVLQALSMIAGWAGLW